MIGGLNLNPIDNTKLILAYFIIYKEVFLGANKSLNNYIEKVGKSMSTQSGGASTDDIEISPFYNAVKVNPPPPPPQGSTGIISSLKNTITNTLGMSKDLLVDYSEDAIIRGVKYTVIVVLTVLILAQEEIQKTSLGDISSVVNKKVKMYSLYLEKLLSDPQHLQAVKELSTILAQVAGEIVTAVGPSLVDLTGKIEDTAKKVSDKAADGVVRTGTSFAQSVIGAVPGVGAIFDFIITAAVAANSFMRVSKTAAIEGQAVVDDINDVIIEVKNIVDKKKDQITGAIRDVDALTSVPSLPEASPLPSAPSVSVPDVTLPSTPQLGGALGIKQKNIQKKLSRTAKRLEDTLERFSGNKRRTRRKAQ